VVADLPRSDLDDIARARGLLERPSLAIRVASYVGLPVEALAKRLPAGAQKAIGDGTRRALGVSLDVALRSLGGKRSGPTADWLHRGIVMASGAAGGAVGLPGLLLELPFSPTVMLRSIADHARAQGEDLSQVAARLECLTVFAYGSPAPSDDAAHSAYFATRAALARSLSRAAEVVARRGIAEAVGRKGAPAVVQLLARIAQRLGVSVTEKAAAQMVPIVGAAGGAAINTLFISHYQDTAWAHFTVRRLERAHGPEKVRSVYRRAGP
jgi:hypothetical protein